MNRVFGENGETGAELWGDDAVTVVDAEIPDTGHVPTIRQLLHDSLVVKPHPEVGEKEDIPVTSVAQVSWQIVQ